MPDPSLVERAQREEHLAATDLFELSRIAPAVYSAYLKRERERLAQAADDRHIERKNDSPRRASVEPKPARAHKEGYGKVTPTLVRWLVPALKGQPRRFLALAVANAILSYTNHRTHKAWPSLEKLAQDVCSTVRSVSKVIGTLEDIGLITIRRRQRQSNIYTLYLDSPNVVKSKDSLDSPISNPDSPP